MTMSPDQLVPDHWKAVLVISVPWDMGRAAVGIAPKRESPWTIPVVPRAWPPSATMPTLTLVCDAHVWNAPTISLCQAQVGAIALKVLNRTLGLPATSVPSGTKLSVRCDPSSQV